MSSLLYRRTPNIRAFTFTTQHCVDTTTEHKFHNIVFSYIKLPGLFNATTTAHVSFLND